jgi:hypothetical protein
MFVHQFTALKALYAVATDDAYNRLDLLERMSPADDAVLSGFTRHNGSSYRERQRRPGRQARAVDAEP